MNRINSIVIKTCFWIWAVQFLLPAIWGEYLVKYRPFEIFLRIGGYINILVMALAVIAFLVALFKNPFRKKAPAPDREQTTLILHDLDEDTAGYLFDPKAGDSHIRFFCAGKKRAACQGYYSCWLKTPGTCALRDGTEDLGRQIADCDELVIISKNLYGGFSREIKSALDRSISTILPFFRFSNREVHHLPRYANRGNMRVYIYDSVGMSESDQNSIREIALANSININKNCGDVIFLREAEELRTISEACGIRRMEEHKI